MTEERRRSGQCPERSAEVSVDGSDHLTDNVWNSLDMYHILAGISRAYGDQAE